MMMTLGFDLKIDVGVGHDDCGGSRFVALM